MPSTVAHTPLLWWFHCTLKWPLNNILTASLSSKANHLLWIFQTIVVWISNGICSIHQQTHLSSTKQSKKASNAAPTKSWCLFSGWKDHLNYILASHTCVCRPVIHFFCPGVRCEGFCFLYILPAHLLDFSNDEDLIKKNELLCRKNS